MAPAEAEARRKPRDGQYLFDLGVRGRKTGVTVPDTGIRDEHGLEPMDDLFSSPEKPAPKSTRSHKKANASTVNGNTTLSSSDDMDVNESTIPEPADVLTERKRASMRYPLPRSKSPIKTSLLSPARRHPSLGPQSSPTRPSAVRKLFFPTDGTDASSLNESDDAGAQGSVTRLSPPVNYPEDISAVTQEESMIENGEDSFQQVQYEGDDEPISAEESNVELVEVEPEPEPEPPAKPGRKRKAPAAEVANAEEAPVKRARGRPAKKAQEEVDENEDEDEPDEVPTTKGRRPGRQSLDKASETEALEITNKTKAGRKKSSEDPSPKNPKKAPGRKERLETVPEDSPQVSRGPPMPRNNRGLLLLRRETPNTTAGFQQTRSGRNSIKPLAYWRGERVEWDPSESVTDGNAKILLPAIKEVVRTEESVLQTSKRNGQKKGKKSKKPSVESDSDDEDEREPWEVEPGRIVGEVREWDPIDPLGAQATEKEDELALSSAAIITREIAGAQFRFAKTLTLPFFGSGMVDLPPGAMKKPKNSRKMQMVFFVHYGRVQVSINDNIFRIGKGGMWQVPRGNFYSIHNDYDKPARIFFSQGNEVEVETVAE
ncbi:hypothetical protein BP5796_00999 [Coleophoma crateriformis]|uniref:CENP-C homolog n=1 Tax=Coleophoma crateriformis TaxID=565419 RepID=A0A3D8T9L7_9HELO|nr:hypothetical protein BP5796_00999 [Coleophoma crateriformis]